MKLLADWESVVNKAAARREISRNILDTILGKAPAGKTGELLLEFSE